jgi:cyclohexadieny/prephenate dehydrogenase
VSAGFNHIAIIGCGLIGSSLARATRKCLPETLVTGWDAQEAVRTRADALGLFSRTSASLEAAVAGAELVILATPVGVIGEVARALAPYIARDTIITDVGSSKAAPLAAMRQALPHQCIVPAHPVAGTEQSGPEAGFASLFAGRWCILTPEPQAESHAVARVSGYWQALGAQVDVMDAEHHDKVLAITSHVPHLIAYTIVGTASDLEMVTQSEVIKYSAGGFRDFTRIAASDPIMWRDVFLNNKEAVLEILQRFNEDLSALQRAIRWGDGETLLALFTRTRAVRRGIIEQGQDDERPDFGRTHKA